MRVLTIASIGFRAAGGVAPGFVDCGQIQRIPVGWKRQENFVSQCRFLSKKAYWWNILQNYEVSFDPRLFDDLEQINKDRKNNSVSQSRIKVPESKKYITSLVPILTEEASRKIACPMKLLSLISRFVKAFKLDDVIAPQNIIEFLLSWPNSKKSEKCETTLNIESKQVVSYEIRYDTKACEIHTKHLLSMIPSCIEKCTILRRCLRNFEESGKSGNDYEKYDLILSLYYRELTALIVEDTQRDTSNKRYIEERECIIRRRDALQIFDTFFTDGNNGARPQVQKLFLPLPKTFKLDNKTPVRNICGVLGNKSKNSDKAFDPLEYLEPFLSIDSDFSTSKALAPLCNALGLPPGYIHARLLCIRFEHSKRIGASLPSFDIYVRPVLNRLRSNDDRAELSEWCANEYGYESTERLKSLTTALDLAIGASNELERRIRLAPEPRDSTLLTKGENALDAVKRISSETSALSDKILVRDIFENHDNRECRSLSSRVKQILSSLIDTIQYKHADGPFLTPEIFIEGLLIEGSLMASESILDEKIGFKMHHFREVARIVHLACKSLAGQYSHINLGRLARKIIRKWLAHGDDQTLNVSSQEKMNDRSYFHRNTETNLNTSIDIDDEDTANFSMDLNAIALSQSVWTDDLGTQAVRKEHVSTVTLDEEPSALKALGNPREMSDFTNARVGLRVAFVMSFAEDFHSSESHKQAENKENINSHAKNIIQTKSNYEERCQEERKTKSCSQALMKEHAKFLLDIVFAKNNSFTLDSDISVLSESNSCKNKPSTISKMPENTSNYNKRKEKKMTFTFTMRHRALRAASVLCPQRILESTIEAENYFRGEALTIAQCCFGSFLAMEIEQMGLPLPHSDIVQLSIMHYPSYARALWRSHGNSECKGFKGRLLFLLLQLSLKDDATLGDQSLLLSICRKIRTMKLPRTQLCVCESLLQSKHLKSLLDYNNGEGYEMLVDMVTKSAKEVLAELRDIIESVDTSSSFASALRRVAIIFSKLPERDSNQKLLSHLVESICKLVTQRSHKDNCDLNAMIRTTLLEQAIESSFAIQKVDLRSRAITKILRTEGGRTLLEKHCNIDPSRSSENLKDAQNTENCNILLQLSNDSLNARITSLR